MASDMDNRRKLRGLRLTGMNATRTHRSSTHRSPVSALVADGIAIAVFALLARIAHNTPEMPLSFVGWLDTTWPFLLGVALAWALLWFGVLPQLRNGGSGHDMASGVVVWIFAVVVGLLVWGLRHGQVPHWSFMLVATIMSAILLLGWRGILRLRSRKA